jgi:CubicO group peptidase (beta-lactamase class C family)
MTAAGLAVLYEEARIDLDAPVRQYVPDWPAMHATITARQLAGHLSGIRHYPPDGDEFFNARRYTNLLDALEIFRDDSLLFEPGTRYSYSTYGYNLLGAVMQEASGEGFLEFLEHNVFQPIGMRSTVGDHSDSIIPYRTSFYERSGGGNSYHTRKSGWHSEPRTILNAPFSDNSNKWPGGGFLTTPEDLVRFGFAHLEPGFLKEETLEVLFTPQRTASGEETGYGIGWNIGRDDRGYRTTGHGGGSVGGTSRLLMYPDEKVVVAIQVNLTDVRYEDVPTRIAWMFMPRPPTQQQERGAGSRERLLPPIQPPTRQTAFIN